MSRVFDGNLANYLTLPISQAAAQDHSFFCYMKVPNAAATSQECPLSIVNDTVPTVPRAAFLMDDTGAGRMRHFNQLASDSINAYSTNVLTNDNWHAVCGVYVESTREVRVYLDNNVPVSDTRPTGGSNTLTRLAVGILGDSTLSNALVGNVAQVMYWAAALSDADVNTLMTATTSAQLNAVQNASQVCHFPMEGADLSDLNAVVADLTINGTVASSVDDPLAAGPTKTASVRLADLNGNDRANVASVPWAWYDGLPIAGLGPTDAGTGATDGLGNMTVDIPNSTLNAGGVGYLLIDIGAWQSIHAVTVTES